MSSRLNKILYNYDVFDTAESIIALEPYMVGSILPIIIQENELEQEQEPTHTPNNTRVRTDKFCPNQGQDTLFWSVFIAHYGLKEFYNVDRYKNREIDEKVNIMNYIKSLSKTDVHITKTHVQEMMGELMVAKDTTLFIVNALCMYYKMGIVIVYKNTYLEFDLKKILTAHDGEIPIGIIYKNETGSKYNKYSVDLHVTDKKLNSIRDTKVRLEHYDQPLKGISTYKITDLEMMLFKLEPNVGVSHTKLKKKDLYENIWRNTLFFSTKT